MALVLILAVAILLGFVCYLEYKYAMKEVESKKCRCKREEK